VIDWGPPKFIPDPGIFSSECFARNHADRTVRRALKAWWVDSPRRWVAWLMLNPSKANSSRNDNTTRTLTHFTRNWADGGPYDGWIAVNLYPFVSPKPPEARSRAHWQRNGPDLVAKEDIQTNLEDISEVARLAARRLVAYGAQQIDHDEAWLNECLAAFAIANEITDSDHRFYCLEKNGNGQPRHPWARGKTKIPRDRQPWLWDGRPPG
jgi:hypothetical protein